MDTSVDDSFGGFDIGCDTYPFVGFKRGNQGDEITTTMDVPAEGGAFFSAVGWSDAPQSMA